MPLVQCEKDGQRGWKYGSNNKSCFVGKDAKRRAAIQGWIIEKKTGEKTTAHIDRRLVQDVINKRLEVELSSEKLSTPIVKFADRLVKILEDGGQIEDQELSFDDLVTASDGENKKMKSVQVEPCTNVGKKGWKASGEKGSGKCYTGRDGKRRAYLESYALEHAEDHLTGQKKTAASELQANMFVRKIATELTAERLSPEYRAFADKLIDAEWMVTEGINLAPKSRAWSGSEARKALAKWAGGPSKKTIKWSKYKQGFLMVDGPSDSFGSYKLPVATVINGKLTYVYNGVKAAYSALKGGRGGVDGPGKAAALKKAKRLLKLFGDNPDENKKKGK